MRVPLRPRTTRHEQPSDLLRQFTVIHRLVRVFPNPPSGVHLSMLKKVLRGARFLRRVHRIGTQVRLRSYHQTAVWEAVSIRTSFELKKGGGSTELYSDDYALKNGA